MRTLQDSIEVINVSSTDNQQILLKYLIISKSGFSNPNLPRYQRVSSNI
jgi:hypothetical protein